MKAILILLLLLHSEFNRENVIVQHVDQIELVHFYNDQGGVVWDALNLWDYDSYGNKVCVAWILITDGRKIMTAAELEEAERQHINEWLTKHPNMDVKDIPQYNKPWVGSTFTPEKTDAGYVSDFIRHNSYYKIVAKTYKESWVQYDEEQINKEYRPSEFRRGLLMPESTVKSFVMNKQPATIGSIYQLEFIFP